MVSSLILRNSMLHLPSLKELMQEEDTFEEVTTENFHTGEEQQIKRTNSKKGYLLGSNNQRKKEQTTFLSDISTTITDVSNNTYKGSAMQIADDILRQRFSSGFLVQLCKILTEENFENHIRFCHKKNLIFIADANDFEMYVLRLRNMFLKAHTFKQFHRQMVLRGFIEREVINKDRRPGLIVYVHHEQQVNNILLETVGRRENCCNRHLKL